MVLYFKETKLESKEMAVEEVVVGKEIVKKKQNKHDKTEMQNYFPEAFFPCSFILKKTENCLLF